MLLFWWEILQVGLEILFMLFGFIAISQDYNVSLNFLFGFLQKM